MVVRDGPGSCNTPLYLYFMSFFYTNIAQVVKIHILQVARAHVNVSIRSEVIRPDDDLDTEHPWAVLRVDINSVNATVSGRPRMSLNLYVLNCLEEKIFNLLYLRKKNV